MSKLSIHSNWGPTYTKTKAREQRRKNEKKCEDLPKWRRISPIDKICHQIRSTIHITWEQTQLKRGKWLLARRYGIIQGRRYLLLLAGTPTRKNRSSGQLIIHSNRNQRLGLVQGDNISPKKRGRERGEKPKKIVRGVFFL